MDSYYSERLSADRLRECYELAPPRVRQYLEAELQHVATRIGPGDLVLELGCGYGRVVSLLAPVAGRVVGVDTARASVAMAREVLRELPNCLALEMDAIALGFRAGVFDLVVCIQNGISAFHVDQRDLIIECLRVTRPGGRVLLSTYAAGFWPHRLEWFESQAAHGLLGEIDHAATGDGVIVCKDGFRATTVSPAEFEALTAGLPAICRMQEVDGSSLFCELVKDSDRPRRTKP